MTPKLKIISVIAAKNAVNAILTNVALMGLMRDTFHVHSRAGWSHLGWLTLGAVASREAMVWGPKLLAWSQSHTNGNSTS